ncbi:hypothetical protein NNO_0476 [Hydrogenimonas sp.]|nr:hypothetical protein NNO_0476 [Hydrogenimonas sp.]
MKIVENTYFPETNDKKNRRLLLLVAKIMISVSLLLYLILKLDFETLAKFGTDIILYIFVSIIVMLISLIFMTVRWKYVLMLIKEKAYFLPLLYKLYLIGSFFNIFIPGAIGGDAIRLYYISKVYHLSKTKSLLAVFIERTGGLFALGLILMFSLPFNNTIRTKLDFGFTLIILSIFAIIMVLVATKYLINKKISIKYKDLVVILLLSALGQFGDIIVSYLFSLYFGLNITFLNLMSIMPLVYIATVIPISLGGIGVREGVMTAGMALYGINVSDAVMVSLLLYLTKIFVGIIGWLFYINFKPNHTTKEVYHESK